MDITVRSNYIMTLENHSMKLPQGRHSVECYHEQVPHFILHTDNYPIYYHHDPVLSPQLICRTAKACDRLHKKTKRTGNLLDETTQKLLRSLIFDSFPQTYICSETTSYYFHQVALSYWDLFNETS